MKNLFYLLILTIGFVACKKEKTPEPAPQQNITNPPSPTDTTGNVNDTIGKVKIYYEFITTPLTIGYGSGMSGRDYIQDTTNTRILHNGVKLTNHKVTIEVIPSELGLNKLENSSSPATPVWCSIGDTIVFEIDSNEVNMTSGATSDRFLHTTIRVWKNAPYLTGNLKYSFDTHNYNAHPELSAIYNQILVSGVYLGTANNTVSGLPQSFYLGGKLRLKYVVQ